MKKMNYKKPELEAINIQTEDIITASFSKTVEKDKGIGLALNEGVLETGVENGTIKLR